MERMMVIVSLLLLFVGCTKLEAAPSQAEGAEVAPAVPTKTYRRLKDVVLDGASAVGQRLDTDLATMDRCDAADGRIHRRDSFGTCNGELYTDCFAPARQAGGAELKVCYRKEQRRAVQRLSDHLRCIVGEVWEGLSRPVVFCTFEDGGERPAKRAQQRRGQTPETDKKKTGL